MITPVKIAAEKAGGVVALANLLGIKHPSLHSWRRVPGPRCIDIERLTGIPREVLRPDIFAPTQLPPASSLGGTMQPPPSAATPRRASSHA